MGVCPICNGLRKITATCQSCGEKMEEKGRLMDYFDDYSPYMEIDLMKLEDGIPDDYKKHECPHLFHCPECGKDMVILVNE